MRRNEGSDPYFVVRAELLLGLRAEGVTDRDLIRAIELVPHELFVPDEFADYAYKDATLPIGFGQSILSPHALARLLGPLDAAGTSKALLIGTGSGYSSALLAHLARRVFSLDRQFELLRPAERRWKAAGLSTIVGLHADGLAGYPVQAPFERILLCGAVEEVPASLLEQLTLGGILVAPVGAAAARQTIIRLVRGPSDFMASEHGFVRVAPLVAGKVRLS